MANAVGRNARPVTAPALLWYTALVELALGTLLVVAPQLFTSDVYRPIGPYLGAESAAFVAGGAASLLAVSGFWPSRLRLAVPILAAIPFAAMAENFLLTSVVTGVITYSIHVAAVLLWAGYYAFRPRRPHARIFVLMVGAVLTAIGTVMVVSGESFADQLTYADLARYLWFIAPLFLVAGIGLIATELRTTGQPDKSSRLLLAFASLAAVDLGFLVATFTASHTWTGVVIYGCMAVVLLIAAPRLSMWSATPVLFAAIAATAAFGDFVLAVLARTTDVRLFPDAAFMHPIGSLGLAYVAAGLALSLLSPRRVVPRVVVTLALSAVAMAVAGLAASLSTPAVTPEELLGHTNTVAATPPANAMLVVLACAAILLVLQLRPAARYLPHLLVGLAAVLMSFVALNLLAYMEGSAQVLDVLGPSAIRQHATFVVGSLAICLAIAGTSRLFVARIGDRLFGALVAVGILTAIRVSFTDGALDHVFSQTSDVGSREFFVAMEGARALTSVLVLAVAAGAGVLFLRTVTLPLDEVLDAIARARGGERRAQALVGGEDEIGILARSFNQLTRELADQSDLNERTALHDRLTDLPNRALFAQRLERVVRSERPFTLLYLDLDRFKEINDAFGHDAGDLVLREFAQRLGEGLMGIDTLARFGGDEFGILLPDAGDPAGAMSAAEAVRSTLVRPFTLRGHDVFVEASIGIVRFPTDGGDGETLLRRADIAMYDAKRNGKGLAAYAPEVDPQNEKRLALMSDLRHAIERHELLLHFQPQVRLRGGGACASVEALVRWKHPTRGMVSPADFIPLAEESGFINELTLWVMREATAAVASLHSTGQALHLAVNVSARDLHFPGLVDAVDTALRTTGMQPNALTIEITETAVMADTGRSLDTLARLSALGVRLSIDDFGAGYSSLAYLRRLPVNELKIDRMFVADMLANPSSDAIVSTVIQLGHSLGLSLVAEGVEDADTHDALAARHCDLAQGYHIARPMPLVELAVWLMRHEDKVEIENAAD